MNKVLISNSIHVVLTVLPTEEQSSIKLRKVEISAQLPHALEFFFFFPPLRGESSGCPLSLTGKLAVAAASGDNRSGAARCLHSEGCCEGGIPHSHLARTHQPRASIPGAIFLSAGHLCERRCGDGPRPRSVSSVKLESHSPDKHNCTRCALCRTTRRIIEIISNPKVADRTTELPGVRQIYLVFHWLLGFKCRVRAVASCLSGLCDYGIAGYVLQCTRQQPDEAWLTSQPPSSFTHWRARQTYSRRKNILRIRTLGATRELAKSLDDGPRLYKYLSDPAASRVNLRQECFSHGQFHEASLACKFASHRGCESEHRVNIVIHSPSRALSSELGQHRGLCGVKSERESTLSANWDTALILHKAEKETSCIQKRNRSVHHQLHPTATGNCILIAHDMEGRPHEGESSGLALRYLAGLRQDAVICQSMTGDKHAKRYLHQLSVYKRKFSGTSIQIREPCIRCVTQNFAEAGATVAERLDCSPPSIPGRATPGFSRVGIVPDDAAGRRVFSGISRFSRPFNPALLYTHRISRPRFDAGIRAMMHCNKTSMPQLCHQGARDVQGQPGAACWNADEIRIKLESWKKRCLKYGTTSPPIVTTLTGRMPLKVLFKICAVWSRAGMDGENGRSLKKPVDQRHCPKSLYKYGDIPCGESPSYCTIDYDDIEERPLLSRLVKAVHDKVSTSEINLRKKSLPLRSYILMGALSRPVKLLDGRLKFKLVRKLTIVLSSIHGYLQLKTLAINEIFRKRPSTIYTVWFCKGEFGASAKCWGGFKLEISEMNTPTSLIVGGRAKFALLFGTRLNSTFEPASFFRWVLYSCETTPFLNELHVIGAHSCEAFIYRRRVTQDVSNKAWPNGKHVAKDHGIPVQLYTQYSLCGPNTERIAGDTSVTDGEMFSLYIHILLTALRLLVSRKPFRNANSQSAVSVAEHSLPYPLVDSVGSVASNPDAKISLVGNSPAASVIIRTLDSILIEWQKEKENGLVYQLLFLRECNYTPFTVTSHFYEALLKLYFQDIPPPLVCVKKCEETANRLYNLVPCFARLSEEASRYLPSASELVTTLLVTADALVIGVAVMQWLDHSHLTKANRVPFRAGSTPGFSHAAGRWVSSRISSFPSLAFRRFTIMNFLVGQPGHPRQFAPAPNLRSTAPGAGIEPRGCGLASPHLLPRGFPRRNFRQREASSRRGRTHPVAAVTQHSAARSPRSIATPVRSLLQRTDT
ncbi:hypothetical protein PR048_029443 [Dryococelus australis]|uniref:Uncharacterized protein n=1 Tax=Dryococelus australis TaxID=614101 RepID=A0ABQ9GG89_9NEOP|nr:hypothetical protein PR048_029443 [Dryococelus australis]